MARYLPVAWSGLEGLSSNFLNDSGLSGLFPMGSSVHTSASGVSHGGGGGSFGSPDSSSNDPVVQDLINNLIKPNSGNAVVNNSLPQPVIDYFNADLAKHYGMSAETAYQEALSNTAYQRAIKDMKAAGLNPATIFGAGRGSTAGGVSYVSPASSGGSGGYSAKSSGKLFDEGSYFGLSAIAGLIGMKATKSPTGFWIGQATAQGIMGALNKIIK